MSKKALPEGYRLSRVSLESVIKAALTFEGIDPSSELGKKTSAKWLQWGACIVTVPSGWVAWVYRWDDGGVAYKLEEDHTVEDRKFIQRLFSLARRLSSSSRLLESGEERKKGTSDVSDFTTGTSEDVHGGDSSSGEVPDGESGGGEDALLQDRSSMPTACSAPSAGSSTSADAPTAPARERQDGEGSSEDGACPKSSECASPSKVEGEDALVDGQASTREGTGSQAPCPAPGEDTRLDKEPRELSTVPSPSGADEGEAPAPEREESPSLSFSVKELMRIADRGQDLPSVRSRYSFGGVFADMESLYGIPPRELVNRARRVFARLVSEYGEGEEGPRWDYRKVSARTASFQSWRVSDRKKETGRPAIAVLPDVSGSMSRFAEQVIELSKALMALGVPGAEVITIVQSNGHLLELWANGRKIESFYGWDGSEQVNWYREVFRRWDVRVVILAADWDGEWLYSQIAESIAVDIYWLDVYLSSKVYPTLAKQFPPKWAGKWGGGIKWSVAAARKVRYVYGCGDASDFVRGLELAIRSKK